MKIRKRMVQLTTVALLSILLYAPMAAVSGTKPELRVVNTGFDSFEEEARVLPNGIVIVTGTSLQTWVGDGWDGSVVKTYRLVIRPADQGGMVTGDGYGVFTGTIDDKEGTVKYRIKNIVPDGNFPMGKGTISLLKGTDELAGVKGQGTLNFQTFKAEINMHFEPG